MDKAQLRKLKLYYENLKGQIEVVEDKKNSGTIIGKDIYPILHTIEELRIDFPEIVEGVNHTQWISHGTGVNGTYYSIGAIKGGLIPVINRLKDKLEDSEELSLVIDAEQEFLFIEDDKLRNILKRDYKEMQKTYIQECWKSTIILCGSSIETVLLDVLKNQESKAVDSQKAPPKEKDLEKWDLDSLINVAIDIGVTTNSIDKLSHSVRGYRNVVHPGNEIRNKLTVEKEEATIAMEVFKILIRDLKKQLK